MRAPQRIAVAVACASAISAAPAGAATFDRVSVTNAGAPAAADSGNPVVSADGRYVAFQTFATLTQGNTPGGTPNVYRFDRTARTVALVSGNAFGVGTGGTEPTMSADGRFVAYEVSVNGGNFTRIDVRDMVTGAVERADVRSDGSAPTLPAPSRPSRHPIISANGRYVAFVSQASDLVSGDTNNSTDVFLRDRVAGTTERVSLASDGSSPPGATRTGGVSDDGRRVLFRTFATLAAGDANNRDDIYVRDRVAGTTELVSASAGGAVSTPFSIFTNARSSAITPDGRLALFLSPAANLVPGDTNGREDVFLKDLDTGAIRRVSEGSAGEQAALGAGDIATLSADGTTVAFNSASALAPGASAGRSNAYVKTLASGAVSVVTAPGGQQPDDTVYANGLTSDGGQLVTVSRASNLGQAGFGCTTLDFSNVPPWWDPIFGPPEDGPVEVPAPCFDVYVADTGVAPPANAAPECDDGAASVTVGGSVAISLTCTDEDGDELTYAIADAPSQGTVDDAGDGSATYTPAGAASGTDTFTFTASDGTDEAAPATFTVTINRPPACADAELHVAQGGTLALGSPCSDADGDPLDYSLTDPAARGDVTGTGATAGSYAAGADADGFDHLELAVSDGRGGSASVDVDVLVLTASGVGGTLPPGGGSLAAPGDPLGVALESPAGGPAAIDAIALGGTPAGFVLLGREVRVSAPHATAADPLALTFTVDGATGADPATLQIFRNGTAVAACDGAAGEADPDPCALPATTAGGDVVVTVLTSHASTWTLGVPLSAVDAVFGPPIRGGRLALAKPGRTVPVKLALSTGGGPVSSGDVALSAPVEVACAATGAAGAPSGAGEPMTWSPDEQRWKAELSTRGLRSGACHRVVATLNGTPVAAFTLEPKG